MQFKLCGTPLKASESSAVLISMLLMTSTSARLASKGEISLAHQRKSLAIKGFCDRSDPGSISENNYRNGPRRGRRGCNTAVCALNDGDTFVNNQSGCDREAVLLHCCTCFEWHLCRHKTVYRHEIRALEPGKGWGKHTLSSGAPSHRFTGRQLCQEKIQHRIRHRIR
jgi:hypothetical protein